MVDLIDSLRGITTPLVTPFSDGDVDWDAFDAVLTHVLEADVDAVFPCGTTGEVASLSTDECHAIVEHTVQRTPSSLPVVVGGTGTAIGPSRDWIADVAELGADGIVATAPFFHPANHPRGYRTFFERVAEDSPLPILLYNIPTCVGEDLPVRIVTELADTPGIIGLKDSSGDLTYGMAIRERTPPGFLVLQGYDPLLLPSMLLGFDGGINAGSNVIPGAYREVTRRPSGARDIHFGAIRPLFELCHDHGFAAGIKAALVSDGRLPRDDVRPPLVSAPRDRADEAIERVRRSLA